MFPKDCEEIEGANIMPREKQQHQQQQQLLLLLLRQPRKQKLQLLLLAPLCVKSFQCDVLLDGDPTRLEPSHSERHRHESSVAIHSDGNGRRLG